MVTFASPSFFIFHYTQVTIGLLQKYPIRNINADPRQIHPISLIAIYTHDTIQISVYSE